MRFVKDCRCAARFCIALILCLTHPCVALNVELAHHDAPRRGQWELLAVILTPPPGGAAISLQDVRGGLIVSRPASSGNSDAATGELRLLIPLPFLADADLPANSWPINVTVTSPAGTQRQRFDLPRSTSINLAPDGRAALRLIIPLDSTTGEPPIPPQLSSLPIIITPLRQEEILSGPILLFASADVLLLSPQLAAKLPEDRAAALINAGLQLLILNDPQKSSLARLPWKSLAADPPAWIAPASPLPRPQVVDARLAQSRILHIHAQPTPRTLTLILLVPVASLILLLLARGLFRRPAIILLAVALIFITLSITSIFYLHTTTPPTTLEVAWSTRLPSEHPASPASLVVSQSFTAFSPLFAHPLHATAGQSAMLFPTFASPRPYFALPNAQLALDVPTPNGLERESALDISLPARGFALYTTRSADLADPLLPAALNSARGVWIEGGHIFAAAPPPSDSADNPILTQWAPTHPRLQPSLLAWYDLAMLASHRYFLELPPDPAAPPTLRLTDLGPSPP